MRVAHLLPFPGVGGTEIGQVRVIRAAAAAGHESYALCLDAAPELNEYLAAEGVAAEPWPRPQPSLKRFPRFIADSLRLARELQRRKTQLIHCGDVLAAYHGAVAGRMAGIPVLCHVRSRRADLLPRELLYIRPANHFAFVSRQTRRVFALQLPEERATVLYDGIRIPAALGADAKAELRRGVLAEFGFPPDTVLAGMFGRIAPAKDFPTLIRAVDILRRKCPAFRLLLVGDREANAATREHAAGVAAAIRAASLASVIRMTGHRTDIERLMQSLDLCVLSSHSEGLPLVVLEAMACGAPVAATAIDGVPEIIEDGVTGLLYPHGDGEALAAQMARLLPGEFAASVAEAGRAHVAAHFSEAAFGRNLAALYRKVAGP